MSHEDLQAVAAGCRRKAAWTAVAIVLGLVAIGFVIGFAVGCAPVTLQEWARDCAHWITMPQCWGG